jgi:hypothetical protein
VGKDVDVITGLKDKQNTSTHPSTHTYTHTLILTLTPHTVKKKLIYRTPQKGSVGV